ncbi:hypothetical protein F2Q68_00032511 [Brassica cretica]|uniref:Uncharacterized protein n=2 Tax=Brassica cretica TaxID=69181 RepID=A0A8S9GEY3_BRACR|nr:hypothetical protein F2Q68_00032511 [Brassica cretica]
MQGSYIVTSAVSAGSCVLVALLLGKDPYIMNLAVERWEDAEDIRTTQKKTGLHKIPDYSWVMLISLKAGNLGLYMQTNTRKLQAVQLTENHTIHNEIEEARLLSEHLEALE